ncbi:MAG: helix-turn-helix domain-containing protein [Trebonia sp.]
MKGGTGDALFRAACSARQVQRGSGILAVQRDTAVTLLDFTDGAPPPQSLSDAEQRVAVLAVLAVRGYSNREISEQLFVTVSTIEQHLTRIFRKLQIGRRSELADALVPRDGAL